MTNPTDVVSILQDLIRLPSVNPMGRDATGSPYFERPVTDYLQALFEQLEVPWHRQTVAPQRDNILARLDGRVPGSTLVFEAHQDTVPVDGMTIDPWEPMIRDNRLYGRGACDDKGPMASMLTAFARLARDRPPHMPTVIMACTVNEENGFTGAGELARSWAATAPPLLDNLPRAMVVAEPTSLNVVVAHKGVVRWQCHTSGRAAHGSCPTQGNNAIYSMGRVITAFQQYADTLRETARHPLLGHPTINLGTIKGGICVNVVPDRCTIELDRRLLPHEDPQEARTAAVNWLAEHLPENVLEQVDHAPPFLTNHGLLEHSAANLAKRVQRIARAAGAQCDQIGVSYATDAPRFAKLGIPTVVFGPGSINQAHTVDEWIDVDELRRAADVFYALASDEPATALKSQKWH
ncbi:MAG: M20 family metallopeptidase [Planctomycetota bacterium]